MRTLPEIRDRIHEIAAELAQLAEETRRRPAVRTTSKRNPPITKEQRRAIRALAAARPELGQQEIALLVGVNHGRVSEVLAGKRGEK